MTVSPKIASVLEYCKMANMMPILQRAQRESQKISDICAGHIGRNY